MTTYYSTFITGLGKVVELALRKRLKNIQINLMLDGLIVYRSKECLEKILNLRFFNNTFLLFHLADYKHNFAVKDLIKNVLQKRSLIYKIPKNLIRNKVSFRVIASEENQIIPIDKKTLERLEAFLGKGLKLRVDRAKPDLEVWLLKRSEGYGFVGLRLTKTPNYEKILYKGELRPELAQIMCVLAELQPSDVVLDPFAGYGSIPIECAKSFRTKQVIAGEKDKTVFKILQNKAKEFKSKITVKKWDALNLAFLTNNSVDKIITDPPWGFYDNKGGDLPNFYKKMVQELVRVLKKDGLLVLLTAQKEIFEKACGQFSDKLLMLNKYNTLVSGKKTAIYKLKRAST